MALGQVDLFGTEIVKGGEFMKCKKLLSFILVCLLLCFMVVGCTSETDEKGYKDITDLYTSTQNEDNTYSYSFTDLDGNILFEKENVVREPKINQVAVSVYELKTQAGTGLSTNWVVYCDVKSSKVSEIFNYVLGAQGNYVICADYKDSKHFITVQNIFDKSLYYKTYELENVSPVAADFALDCKFDNDNHATIAYSTGEDYTETKLTINIP